MPLELCRCFEANGHLKLHSRTGGGNWIVTLKISLLLLNRTTEKVPLLKNKKTVSKVTSTYCSKLREVGPKFLQKHNVLSLTCWLYHCHPSSRKTRCRWKLARAHSLGCRTQRLAIQRALRTRWIWCAWMTTRHLPELICEFRHSLRRSHMPWLLRTSTHHKKWKHAIFRKQNSATRPARLIIDSDEP